MSSEQFTVEVTLPSRSLLYPPGFIPDGVMTIAMMGTQEEKLLAGSRGAPGKLITTILDRIIIEPKVPARDLLTVDRMFLLLKMRILTFGSAYRFKMTCPHCSATNLYDTDLAEIPVNELPDDADPSGDH